MAAASTGSKEPPWQAVSDGLQIRFRLTPRSSRDEIRRTTVTSDGPAFRAYVRAVPADGKANAALIRLAANWLRLPKSSLSLIHGAKSRTKILLAAARAKDLAGTLKNELNRTT